MFLLKIHCLLLVAMLYPWCNNGMKLLLNNNNENKSTARLSETKLKGKQLSLHQINCKY